MYLKYLLENEKIDETSYLTFLLLALRPGSLIGTVRANDIDTFPPISYKIVGNVTEIAVDTFTGQIFLLQKPADWGSNPLTVTISASDQVTSLSQKLRPRRA